MTKRQRNRATTTERGLGTQHRQKRALIAPFVNEGTARCVLCSELIEPGTPWDLDHREDRRGYRGPSHQHCNRSDGAKRGNAARYRTSWAPDGSRIVFKRCGSHSPCAIWSVSPDGRNLRRLSPRCPAGTQICPDYQAPVYSPDARHIAFRRERGATQMIMIADATLRHPRPVGSGYQPAWSPDGKPLAFEWKPRSFQAVYVMNANGTSRQRITPWRLQASDPDWSPDGTRILFASGPADHGNLYTIHPDGTDLQQLTHYHGVTRVEVGSFSSDGQSIVFSTVVGAVNPPASTLPDVFVMNADGTDIRPVTRTRNSEDSADWGPRP
jgi:Tol biopolymer transport system component